MGKIFNLFRTGKRVANYNVRDSGSENTPGTPKRRGRPPKAKDEVKRHNVTIAMAAPVREAIGAAADANGRSISSEIDYRLGISLALDEDTGDVGVRRLTDFIRVVATFIQHETGHNWSEDRETAAMLLGAIERYVRANSPPLTPLTPKLQRLQKMFRAEVAALPDRTESAAQRIYEDERFGELRQFRKELFERERQQEAHGRRMAAKFFRMFAFGRNNLTDFAERDDNPA